MTIGPGILITGTDALSTLVSLLARFRIAAAVLSSDGAPIVETPDFSAFTTTATNAPPSPFPAQQPCRAPGPAPGSHNNDVAIFVSPPDRDGHRLCLGLPQTPVPPEPPTAFQLAENDNPFVADGSPSPLPERTRSLQGMCVQLLALSPTDTAILAAQLTLFGVEIGPATPMGSLPDVGPFPHFVLCDIRHPAGAEALEALRTGPENVRGLPVIALTESANGLQRQRADLLGADLVISWPIAPADLRLACQRAVRIGDYLARILAREA